MRRRRTPKASIERARTYGPLLDGALAGADQLERLRDLALQGDWADVAEYRMAVTQTLIDIERRLTRSTTEIVTLLAAIDTELRNR